MKKTKMLVLTAAMVLGLSTAVEAKLPANAVVIGSNIYDVNYLTSNISKINDEIMNNLGSIFYVDSTKTTKDMFTGSTLDDAQIVNRVGNTLNYYTSTGTVQKLVADSNNQFDDSGVIVGNLSAVLNISYKKVTIGTQTLYAYTVKVNQLLGLQDAAYFSLDTSSTVSLSEVNTYIGTTLASVPRLTVYNSAQKDIASGTITGIALTQDSGTIDVPVALHYDGSQGTESGNGNTAVNLVNSGFTAIDPDAKWMYYVNTADSNKLYKKSVNGVEDTPISDDRAGYINVVGDWIYYVNYSDGSKIYKVRTDGTQRQKVADDMASHLNIMSGKIYYINHSDRARIYVIDSQGKRQLCSDSASLLSAGTNNFLYYLNTLDGNKLYKYLLTTGSKSPVSDVSAQHINVIGDSSVLYTGKDGLLYATNGSYYSNPQGTTAVTNIPSGKGTSTTLKTVNDKLTVICAEDDANIYYKSYADGGKLYKLDKKTGNGYKVLDDSVDFVNIIGDNIYYLKSGKMYSIPKNSDGTAKGTAVTKPKSNFKIVEIKKLDTIRTDDINKVNLPERVSVVMRNGSTEEKTEQLVVNWNKTIPKSNKGVYTFSGTILGYGNSVTVSVILDSGVIDPANVAVTNGIGSKDTVVVSKLNQGDIISVYTGYTDTKPIKTATAASNGIANMTGLNLNPNGDYLYITITKVGKAEGQKTAYLYAPEAPVNFAVDAAAGTISGLKSGMSYKVFLETPDSKTGSLPDVPDTTKQVGSTITAGTNGTISVPQLMTMTDLKQLRLVATNMSDSLPSAPIEVGKPKLTDLSVDLSNARIVGTSAEMEYSYAYDSINNTNSSDWTPCTAITTSVSMTRSLQVSVRLKANGPHLQSDVVTFGLFPAPVITGIKDKETYAIQKDINVGWQINDGVTYDAVIYNLTADPNRQNPVTGIINGGVLIGPSGKITSALPQGTSYELVVTATKSAGGQTGKSKTTVHFAVSSGQPQTVDVTMAEKPGTMKKVSGAWQKIDPATDALTYYSATPTWTDYPSTSSAAVLQRIPFGAGNDLSKVAIPTLQTMDWENSAKVAFAPNTPITQDGYYKLTITSTADDNKATNDTVKYFKVDNSRIAVLPTVTADPTLVENGTYDGGLKSITIADDTTKGTESITTPTLTRDGYSTQLTKKDGSPMTPTQPGDSATSGDITLKGTYQLVLDTVNVVNGRTAHKSIPFIVDNATNVSDGVNIDDILVATDNNSVTVKNVPYNATIKVYNSSGSFLASQTNTGQKGTVTVTIPGGISPTESCIYVTQTNAGKTESNRTQKTLALSPSIKSISPVILNEEEDTGKVYGIATGGGKTNTIAVEVQNGTVEGAESAVVTSSVTLTTGTMPAGLTYSAVKLDDTHVGIVIEGTADPTKGQGNKSDSVDNLVFTISKDIITPTAAKATDVDLKTNAIAINFNGAPAPVEKDKIVVKDVGNNGNGGDLQVTFDPSSEEGTKVSGYRIFVVKHGTTGTTFTLADANKVSTGNYTDVSKTGLPITRVLDTSANDTSGAKIVNGTAYDIYVMAIASGAANINSLSDPVENFTLSNAPIPTIASVAGKTTSPAISKDSDVDVVVNGVSTGNKVTIYDGNTPVSVGSGIVASGQTTITVHVTGLSEGDHTLTATAVTTATSTDAGATSAAFKCTVDKIISTPTVGSGSTINSLVLNASNGETDWASVTITNGGSAKVASSSYSVSAGKTCNITGITASDTQTVVFTVTDIAGNTKQFTATLNGTTWTISG
ncbi:DUF5050 domain-containing protein [Clostridium sp. P21]|uniref:DUF5050 domain-containing protein n=1 Tax=Clostridium muellerianum TaxID=2716538 RepID=A0A7Y0EDG6_9CLOT|nr:DUF5050 domain-containing protein [Clostridium muellerianum]NMM61464.1 DUF5050 domain-containing protein [Clostridium muellerianum]